MINYIDCLEFVKKTEDSRTRQERKLEQENLTGFRLYKTLWFRQHWLYFAVNCFNGFLAFCCEIILVIITSKFLSSTQNTSQSKLLTVFDGLSTPSIEATIILVLCVAGFKFALIHFKQFIAFRAEQRFNASMRNSLIDIGLNSTSNLDPSRVLYFLNEVIPKNGEMIHNLGLFVSTIGTAGLLLIAGFFTAPYEMLVSLVFTGVGLIAYFQVFRGSYEEINESVRDSFTQLNQSLTYSLKNRLFLRINDLTDRSAQESKTSIQTYKDQYDILSRHLLIKGVTPMIIGLCCLASAIYIGRQFGGTSLAELVSFLYIFFRLTQTVGESSHFFSRMKYNEVSLKELNALLEAQEKSSETKLFDGPKVESISQLKAESISFSYGKRQLFKDIDFDLKPSNILLVKGPSGKGKSTLMSLLIGTLQPQDGKLTVNNQSSIPENYWSKIAYVGPDEFFFPGSLKQNLNPYKETPSTEKVKTIFEQLNLQELLPRLDEQIELIPQLSTGQKKRIELARALLKQPQIMFLDEVTAHLDADNSQNIVKIIQEISKDKIVVVVSHENIFDSIATHQVNL